nr:protein ANTAGONIST OF LIKE HETEROCHROMATIN PROTEIN 1-like [Rhipicephalus microplus]
MAVALCEIDEDCYSFRRKRSCWQKDWVGRKELGVQNLLYKELLKTDHEEYRRLLRVSREQFLQLLSRVETRIQKKDTVMRQSISAETRLQVTLRYLASGESQHSLSCQFRLGHSSVNDIIYETCRAIYEELGGDLIRTPGTEEEWKNVMEGFSQKWNFPNCIGAIDGKHVLIKKPPKLGTIYRNYKKSFSVILLAVVDADYKFLYTDIERHRQQKSRPARTCKGG